MIVGLIDIQLIFLDGLLFFFECLDAEQELVCFFAGIAGGGDGDVEGIDLVVKPGERQIDVLCLFVKVVLDVA